MISVALPVIIIFSFVAVVSYYQLKDLFNTISSEKIENLQDELMSVIRLQDVSMAQMSRNIARNSQDKMRQLRYDYFETSDSIETADLSRIRKEIGMNESDAIYIINKDGIIINTTFENDLNFNLFKIDDDLKEFLKTVFSHDFYVPEPMSLETSTRKFKKYIYQRSPDGNYIIQLGFYSNEADRFNAEISKRFAEISNDTNDIESIDLILAPWKPFSMYSGEDVSKSETPLIQTLFEKKRDSIIETEDMMISYIFFEKNNTEAIRWTGILKVVYDKQRDREILASNITHKLSLFGFGMILLFIILYVNVLLITRPVRDLSDTARKLGSGELGERTKPGGSKEIYYLSEAFNHMAENLEKSHKEITRKNEEILASINYAKRIQEAILPSDVEVTKYLPDHFIMYEPKDIVAGDFYWFETAGDDIYIASADCTGHGVPGAMVSVVCSNAMNRTVNELGISEPAKILDSVRELVILTFEKSHHDVKDGMDICFCKIDRKNRKITFSGAQNSLYVVKKVKGKIEDPKCVHDDEHMLLELKADKQPIGKFTAAKPFTQHEVYCEKGDCIYLFTDGFADQFGGQNEKKFMYKPFKQLLVKLHKASMEDQRAELERTFENWRGPLDQVDDVCVIGIRMT